VRQMEPGQAPAELELIENAQRRELSDAEEADAFIQLTRESGRNLQAIADMSGRSVAYVSKRIRLFEDAAMREALVAGQVATSQAEELLALPEAMRGELLARSVALGWTHAQMRSAVRKLAEANGDAAQPAPASSRGAQPPNFRVENAHGQPTTPRPRDLTRRIRDLDAVLGALEPFQLTQRDDRALGELWKTLRRLARAARRK
jgi:ParB-like chromosome segregation protein Spo0J